MRRFGFLSLILAAFTVSASTPEAWARRNLVVDISKPEVAITTSFVGESLLLFGSTLGRGEIVIVVRGPKRPEVVHRKKRIAGVWVNRDSIKFDHTPFFYTVASTQPLKKIMPDELRIEHEIGIEFLHFGMKWNFLKSTDMSQFRKALIRNKQRQGLYYRKPATISYLGHQLFRADIYFPSNVMTGNYQVEIYLVRNKKIISKQKKTLIVRKAGLEASIYDFAHDKPFYYGIIAIFISAFPGWLISVFFRKS